MQNVAEYGYLFVRDGIARDTIGKEGDKFVPLLFSFFFFIWMINLMSIIPFAQFPVTSRFAIPLAFAAARLPALGAAGRQAPGRGSVLQGHDDAARTSPRRCTSC